MTASCLNANVFEVNACHWNESCRIEQEHEAWNSALMTHSLPPPFWADLPLGLILIRQKALVGQLPGDHKVYKITKIVVIPLSEDEPQDLELEVTNTNCFVQTFSMLDLIKVSMESNKDII